MVNAFYVEFGELLQVKGLFRSVDGMEKEKFPHPAPASLISIMRSIGEVRTVSASEVRMGDLIDLGGIPANRSTPGPTSGQDHQAYHRLSAREVLVENRRQDPAGGHVYIRWTGPGGPREDTIPEREQVTLLPTTTAALHHRLEGYIAEKGSDQDKYDEFREKFPQMTHGFLVPSPESLAELDRRIGVLQAILAARSDRV